MKKIFLIASVCMTGYFANAQKIGYFNSSEVLKDNKDIKKIDSSLNAYSETLKAEYTYLQEEYTEKSGKLKDSTMAEAKKAVLKDDITSLGAKISSYQTDVTKKFNDKREVLLAPVAKKLNDIVSKLATTEKYEVIFDVASTPVFYISKTNDLTAILKEKMK